MKRILICIFIAAAVFVLCRPFFAKRDVPEIKAVPLPVHAVSAAPANIPFEYAAVGTAEALQKVAVRPQISGKLTALLFKEGGMVEKGDLIAEIDDSETKAALVRATAELTANQAKSAEAEKNLKRLEKLKQSGFVSQKNWDAQKSLCAQLRAAVQSGMAQAEIARINNGYTRITAPISGRIGFKNADAGNIVSSADVIAEIVQTDPVFVVFSVPQSLFSHLENNAAAVVNVTDALTGEVFGRGKIAAVDNAFNAQTGTIKVRAVVENGKGRLRAGQSVAVGLIYGESASGLVLPKKAVRPGLNGAFVFTVENGRVAVVPVQTGYANDESVVVLSGLQAGDLVVTDNFSRLKSGAEVEVSIERKMP